MKRNLLWEGGTQRVPSLSHLYKLKSHQYRRDTPLPTPAHISLSPASPSAIPCHITAQLTHMPAPCSSWHRTKAEPVRQAAMCQMVPRTSGLELLTLKPAPIHTSVTVLTKMP